MLNPGDIVDDRYKIVQKLGSGGMGAVYEAEQMRLSSRVAIKEFSPNGVSDPQELLRYRQAFIREGRILRLLNPNPHNYHPNIAYATDAFDHNGSHFLVMAYIPGPDLDEYTDVIYDNLFAKDSNGALKNISNIYHNGIPVNINGSRKMVIDRDDVIEYMEQILKAFDHMHGQQDPIIYRDLKPSNIKLTPNGILVVLDFGAAVEDSDKYNVDSLGTPGYAAPEQFRLNGSVECVSSDIYAAGAVMYRILTGDDPGQINLSPQMFQELQDRISDTHLKRSDIEKKDMHKFKKIMRDATNLDPNKRFSAKDMLGELESMKGSGSNSTIVKSSFGTLSSLSSIFSRYPNGIQSCGNLFQTRIGSGWVLLDENGRKISKPYGKIDYSNGEYVGTNYGNWVSSRRFRTDERTVTTEILDENGNILSTKKRIETHTRAGK